MIYFLNSKKMCMLHDLFIYLLVLGGFLHVGITYDTGVYIRVSTEVQDYYGNEKTQYFICLGEN